MYSRTTITESILIYMFYEKENYVLHFKSGKLFWRLSFRNSIQDRLFLLFTRPKKCLE